jgi:acyl-CoA thioesterase-1
MNREAAPRRVLFFGDSLVAGVGDPAGGGWVARIAGACFEQGVPLTAYNLGVRRETSVEVAARWRAEAEPRLPIPEGARLVVSFGANDTTVENGSERVAAADSRRALATLLDEAEELGVARFVVGPAPVDDAEQNVRIGELTRSFAEVCDERGVPFLAVVDALLASSVWMSEIAVGDGAHPSAGGYEAITRVLLDGGLLTWLKEPAPES